jgi:hypothetical protein
MKKAAYIFIISMVAALSITACTEEEISPNTALNGGGTAMDPK